MDVKSVLYALEENSNPSRKKSLIKAGAPEDTYGVLLGFLRKYAKKIGMNHELANQLWDSGNTDARLLSVMLFNPKTLSIQDVVILLKDVTFDQILDDFIFRVAVYMDELGMLKDVLMSAQNHMLKRGAWAINVHLVALKMLSNDAVYDLIDTIKSNLVDSPKIVQWMMNRCFAQIGISYESFRDEVLDLGRRLGVYKNMHVAPGCTSAYVVDWINAVVK